MEVVKVAIPRAQNIVNRKAENGDGKPLTLFRRQRNKNDEQVLNDLCHLELQGNPIDWPDWYQTQGAGLSYPSTFAVHFNGTNFEDLELQRLEETVIIGENEVEVRIVCCSLNYRDKFLILLNKELQQGVLGFDLAGIITRVGSNVTKFKIPDKVYGFTMKGGALATHIIVPDVQLATIPAHLNMESASTIPYSYLIAWKALVDAAKIGPGDTVLVNLGWSGWIGVAIAQMAQNFGAKVFGICGTVERRKYFESIGIEHVYDLQVGDFEFLEEILKDTEGEGLTVVVNNFLEIEEKVKCLKLCASWGRFMDISPSTDISSPNGKLLRPDVRYYRVDLRQESPESLLRGWTYITEEFENRNMVPFPSKVFPVDVVEKVLRWFHEEKLGLAKPVILMPTNTKPEY